LDAASSCKRDLSYTARRWLPDRSKQGGFASLRSFASLWAMHVEEVVHADDQPVDPQAAPAAGGAQQGSGARGQPAEARRVHPRLHDDAEEAEFGASEGGARPLDERV